MGEHIGLLDNWYTTPDEGNKVCSGKLRVFAGKSAFTNLEIIDVKLFVS